MAERPEGLDTDLGGPSSATHDAGVAAAALAAARRRGGAKPDVALDAYAEWGEALLAAGDVDGAIAKLSLAAGKAPHFADPPELWGEVKAQWRAAAGMDLSLADRAELARAQAAAPRGKA